MARRRRYVAPASALALDAVPLPRRPSDEPGSPVREVYANTDAADPAVAFRSAAADLAANAEVWTGAVQSGESDQDKSQLPDPGDVLREGDRAIGVGMDLVEVSFLGYGRPRGRAWFTVAEAKAFAARVLEAVAAVEAREAREARERDDAAADVDADDSKEG